MKNAKERQIASYLQDSTKSITHNCFTIAKFASDYRKVIERMEKAEGLQRAHDRKMTLKTEGVHKKVSSLLKEGSAKPLDMLERDIGPKKGTLTSDPNEIDDIARRAWKPIFDGNARNINR
eukprot:4635451-Karenia_brevis.AAC.1